MKINISAGPLGAKLKLPPPPTPTAFEQETLPRN